MPVYLSPAVFPNEIDLTALPANTSSLVPAFVGTTQKGPLNKPTLITSAEQYVEIFGAPTPEANLGYSVIGFLEEADSCYVVRVGVLAEEGQPDELASVAIDASGTRLAGWGRIPVFQGIDFGRINLRIPTVDAPLVFHDDAVTDIDYNDIDVSATDGPADATLNFIGSALSDNYVGAIDDAFIVLITSDPTSGLMGGAGYQIIRQSDSAVIGSGTLVESSPGVSEPVAVGSGDDDSGLIFEVQVTGTSPIEQDDTFSFVVQPNNRTFAVEVEGQPSSPATFSMPVASYDDPDDFVTAFNTVVGSSVDFLAVYDGTNLALRTVSAGERIQLVGTEGFALEVGVQKWVWDIPRSYLLGVDTGPYNINSSNNVAAVQVIGADSTVALSPTVAPSLAATPASVASALHLGGVYLGDRYFESFALQVSDDDQRVVLVTTAAHQSDQLKLLSDFSHVKTLRFAEELNINVATRAPRAYSDPRVALPASGVITSTTPLACETDPAGAQCALDTAYYNNLVGYFVAPTPGTWLNGHTLSLENFNGQPGRYSVRLFDAAGLEIADARVDDASFDPTDTRYIANLVNPGSTLGGVNGSSWINWEDRPVFLANDPNDSTSFEVRYPSQLNRKAFVGMANGIPTDVEFASELDRAVIGRPSDNSGIYAFQNPESYDITLLATPGFSSGSVIAQCLQMCEGRGDCLYLVDPPFGLRPQQVVDWHNGMLLSDLQAALNSSYGALYWSWLEVFDQFNGGTVWVPPSGHVAAIYARTARTAEPWYAPAGLNRGRLLTAQAVEYNPSVGERNLLYGFNNAVNPIVSFPQEGITVWGQRTLQRKDSALDRVNVRMLLIFLKKGLIPLLRNYLFEPNDRTLWAQVQGSVDPYLADIRARRGILAFKTVVDETNNTPIRRDRNELWVSVFIKPTRAVEFIVLNLVLLRTDQSFASDEVLAAAGIPVAQEF